MLEKLFFFVILLGVLVTVHELGHFSMAKLFKVQVFKFSIGFGPELIGFQWGETRYAISAIPLGGFVRMAGEEDLLERWGGPDAPPPDPKRLLNAKPRWQRALIMLAGPVANLILPAVTFSIAAYGSNNIPAPVVGTILPDTPAERAGLQSADRIVSISGHKIRSFGDISDLVGPRAGQNIKLQIERQKKPLEIELKLGDQKTRNALQQVEQRGRIGIGAFRRMAIVTPLPGNNSARRAGLKSLDKVLRVDGKEVEDFAALQKILGNKSKNQSIQLEVERRALAWDGSMRLDLPQHLQLSIPPLNSETAKASATTVHQTKTAPFSDQLRPRLAGVEEQEIENAGLKKTIRQSLKAAQMLCQKSPPSTRGIDFAGACLASVLANSPAQQLGLKRGDCLLSVDGKQAFHWSLVEETLQTSPKAIHIAVAEHKGKISLLAFRLQKRPEVVPIRRGMDRFVFGAGQMAVLIPGRSEEIHRGPVEAIVAGLQRTADLTVMTAAGIGLLLTGKLPFTSVGGPMMLFDLAGQSAERGLSYFIFMLAFISINLGVLNLLPVPVLDGGHLFMLGIEAVIRRPLPKRAAEIANLVGLSLLLLLMMAVMGNDLARYWRSILGIFG